MKKISSQKLPSQLLKYNALCAAIAGITDANGQTINYVDIQDQGGPGVVVVLDLNGDGQGDFNIRNVSYLYNSFYRSYLGILPTPGNAVLGSTANSLIYPFALDEGAMISSGNPSWRSNFFYQTLIWSYCYSNSNWCGVTDKYLGLRFTDLSANTYYGWARLDVTAANDWVIKDYAWNYTPNASILAGAGGPLSIEDKIFSNVKILSLNKSIALYNLPQMTNYNLFTLSGQSVLKGKIKNHTYVIEANTIASGVYIIELQDHYSKATLRKKVVI